MRPSKTEIGLVVVLFALAAWVCVGCRNANQPTTQPTTQAVAPDSTQLLILANQSFAATVDTLNGLHNAGVFTAADWANIKIGITAASNALDAWQANINSPTAAQAAFQAVLPQLLTYIKTGAAKATTTPTTKAVQ